MARKAYSLEMAMEKPEEVEELYLHQRNLDVFPSEIFQLKNLKKLDLSLNKITEIPKEINQLTRITELHLRNNNLTDCSFENLDELIFSKLQALDLYGNSLSIIPSKIFKFKNLQVLSLDKNRIKEVSSELIKLKALIHIGLSYNCIKTLPSQIGQLKNLKGLDLDGNQLKYLPKTFINLEGLRHLILKDNPLRLLPDKFEHLKNLDYLQFSISQNFSTKNFEKHLINVKSLEVFGDKKLAIPINIFHLSNLTNLKLIDFGSSTIDKEITHLCNLRKLVIGDTPLKVLSDNIGDLNSLHSLSICGSRLKRLPTSFIKLKNLRQFYANKNLRPSEVIRFLKKIKSETFPTYLKEVAFNFLFSKDNSLVNLSKKDLLILVQFPFQNLGETVTNLLFQKHSLDILKNPFDKNTHLALLGTTNLNLKKINPHLKNISKKITHQTTHIVLGKLPGEIENLSFRDFVFVRESELNLWLQQQVNPYLLSSSKEEIKNLSRLLLSFQDANIDIALQLMETGGVPTILLTDLVIVFKKLPASKQKRAIRKLLSLNLSEEALKVVSLKTGLLKGIDLEKKVLELTAGTELNGLKIFKWLTAAKK
jgi:Leucine-rich repeat (LRR) protein